MVFDALVKKDLNVRKGTLANRPFIWATNTKYTAQTSISANFTLLVFSVAHSATCITFNLPKEWGVLTNGAAK